MFDKTWDAPDIQNHLRISTGAKEVKFICNAYGQRWTGYDGDVYRITLHEDDSKVLFAIRSDLVILDDHAERIRNYIFMKHSEML